MHLSALFGAVGIIEHFTAELLAREVKYAAVNIVKAVIISVGELNAHNLFLRANTL